VDRQQLLILVAASVMLASFVLFVLVPRRRELADLDYAVDQARGLLSRRVSVSHEGVYVSARIPELRKAQAVIERRLPAEPKVAEFLQMMDACLGRHPAVSHEVVRSTLPWAGATPAVPLRLRLRGPFDGVYRSLAGIEGLERVSRLRRVQIQADGADGDVVAEAEILVYYLPREPQSDPVQAVRRPEPEGDAGPAAPKDREAS
jgi:hypothetical protein